MKVLLVSELILVMWLVIRLIILGLFFCEVKCNEFYLLLFIIDRFVLFLIRYFIVCSLLLKVVIINGVLWVFFCELI